ncbi:hypothetical protein K435DRAFT_248589 [Dendrothele bispora CBS 962.96]|uniref:Uncharacterized protein n=1 Tax=Dendrothele bispora (strain CBS 962.96) TaxID=1314807 RepID=A0A4S8LNA9_DENBC|nr:hypothetical protein K435DRAFT_248589 [Dendrothele bispora CBS 962.96]
MELHKNIVYRGSAYGIAQDLLRESTHCYLDQEELGISMWITGHLDQEELGISMWITGHHLFTAELDTPSFYRASSDTFHITIHLLKQPQEITISNDIDLRQSKLEKIENLSHWRRNLYWEGKC